MKAHIIDVSGKKLGRAASEIASILLGKDSPSFEKNKVADVKVSVVNAAKLDISEKKARTKVYGDYSGYPGGLKKKTLGEMATRKGFASVLERAVAGMIHNTKLKVKMLKNLTIKE